MITLIMIHIIISYVENNMNGRAVQASVPAADRRLGPQYYYGMRHGTAVVFCETYIYIYICMYVHIYIYI